MTTINIQLQVEGDGSINPKDLRELRRSIELANRGTRPPRDIPATEITPYLIGRVVDNPIPAMTFNDNTTPADPTDDMWTPGKGRVNLIHRTPDGTNPADVLEQFTPTIRGSQEVLNFKDRQLEINELVYPEWHRQSGKYIIRASEQTIQNFITSDYEFYPTVTSGVSITSGGRQVLPFAPLWTGSRSENEAAVGFTVNTPLPNQTEFECTVAGSHLFHFRFDYIFDQTSDTQKQALIFSAIRTGAGQGRDIIETRRTVADETRGAFHETFILNDNQPGGKITAGLFWSEIGGSIPGNSLTVERTGFFIQKLR